MLPAVVVLPRPNRADLRSGYQESDVDAEVYVEAEVLWLIAAAAAAAVAALLIQRSMVSARRSTGPYPPNAVGCLVGAHLKTTTAPPLRSTTFAADPGRTNDP